MTRRITNSRRLSFSSLVVGFTVGCCIIYFFNLSVQTSYRVNNIVPDLSQFPIQELRQNENASTINNFYTQQDGKEAEYQSNKKVRVLCWIMTTPKNHETKALSVKETWGKRCDILLFMSSKADMTLPTIQLPVSEGRNQLWGKTREAFRYIWKHYQDEADWFLKADDDTFVIVENLRYFLSSYKTSDPLWFGHKFKSIVKKGYFSGGAGYVLSKEATRRFVEEGYFNKSLCRHDHGGAEDVEIGKCLQNLNVSAMDTRDSKGRGRFFPFNLEQHMFPGKISSEYWYWKNIYYPPTQGDDCCSDSAISIHYVTPKQMRLLDYFIYRLRPFGLLVEERPVTPEPPPDLDLTATPWFAPNETVIPSITTTNITNDITTESTNVKNETKGG